jgi:hypothetical protein
MSDTVIFKSDTLSAMVLAYTKRNGVDILLLPYAYIPQMRR